MALGYTLGIGNRVLALRSTPLAPRARHALSAPAVILRHPDGSPVGRCYGPPLCASELSGLYGLRSDGKRRAPPRKPAVILRDAQCHHCGETYAANRSTSRFCGARCRKAASRKP